MRVRVAEEGVGRQQALHAALSTVEQPLGVVAGRHRTGL